MCLSCYYSGVYRGNPEIFQTFPYFLYGCIYAMVHCVEVRGQQLLIGVSNVGLRDQNQVVFTH